MEKLTINDIEYTNRKAGQHFFDDDTLQFFNSIIYPRVHEGGWFVTSEKRGRGYPRLYTIRRAMNSGAYIETIDDFQQFRTYAHAEQRIHEYMDTGYDSDRAREAVEGGGGA